MIAKVDAKLFFDVCDRYIIKNAFVRDVHFAQCKKSLKGSFNCAIFASVTALHFTQLMGCIGLFSLSQSQHVNTYIQLSVAIVPCEQALTPGHTHPLIASNVVDDPHAPAVHEGAQEVLVTVIRRSEQQSVLLPRLEAHGDVVRVRVPRGTDPDPDIVVTAERHDLWGCQPDKSLINNKKLVYVV